MSSRSMNQKIKKRNVFFSNVSRNIRKGIVRLESELFKVQLEGFPFASYRSTSRTPTCTWIAGRTVGWHAVHAIPRTSERNRRTRNEHVDAVSTDAADALRTCITLVQCPRALAICAENLDFPVVVGCWSRIGESMVLSLVDGGN